MRAFWNSDSSVRIVTAPLPSGYEATTAPVSSATSGAAGPARAKGTRSFEVPDTERTPSERADTATATASSDAGPTLLTSGAFMYSGSPNGRPSESQTKCPPALTHFTSASQSPLVMTSADLPYAVPAISLMVLLADT